MGEIQTPKKKDVRSRNHPPFNLPTEKLAPPHASSWALLEAVDLEEKLETRLPWFVTDLWKLPIFLYPIGSRELWYIHLHVVDLYGKCR